MKKIKNKIIIIFIILTFMNFCEYVKGIEFSLSEGGIYNSRMLNIEYGGSVSINYGVIILNANNELVKSTFHVTDDIDTSSTIYFTWFIRTQTSDNSITILSSLASISSDNTEVFNYNIYSNNIINYDGSIVNTIGKIIVSINSTEYITDDIIHTEIKLGQVGTTIYIEGCSAFYKIKEGSIVINGFEEGWEWYLIMMVAMIIINLITIYMSNYLTKQFKIIFLIIGVLYGAIGLKYLQIPIYPFPQLLMIAYSLTINYPKVNGNEM